MEDNYKLQLVAVAMEIQWHQDLVHLHQVQDQALPRLIQLTIQVVYPHLLMEVLLVVHLEALEIWVVVVAVLLHVQTYAGSLVIVMAQIIQ